MDKKPIGFEGPADLHTFHEFFAGGGMVRAGLGSRWKCQFANDFDLKKAETYRRNWGSGELRVADIRSLSVGDLAGASDLAWASFPCQDLSLAGGGAGLRGDRSGTFWPFWDLMGDVVDSGNAPSIIVLENVCGTLTSHKGKDFQAIVQAFHDLGYFVGAMVLDAELWLPHSRPRLFFVGVPRATFLPQFALHSEPHATWHPAPLRRAHAGLSAKLKSDAWLWWHMPLPPPRKQRFIDLIEDEPCDVEWHSSDETGRLLEMMSPLNRKKVAKASAAKARMVGTVYKRTRQTEDGFPIQRAEVRFDDVAGCLRTPAGGSSRQLLLIVEGRKIRSRLISARETARLMGLPEQYKLPSRYNEAYHLTGDGVVVPAVRHLSRHILTPLLDVRDGRLVA